MAEDNLMQNSEDQAIAQVTEGQADGNANQGGAQDNTATPQTPQSDAPQQNGEPQTQDGQQAPAKEGGPQGPLQTGPLGPQGPQGPTGPFAGPQGPTGPQGPQGQNGPTPPSSTNPTDNLGSLGGLGTSPLTGAQVSTGPMSNLGAQLNGASTNAPSGGPTFNNAGLNGGVDLGGNSGAFTPGPNSGGFNPGGNSGFNPGGNSGFGGPSALFTPSNNTPNAPISYAPPPPLSQNAFQQLAQVGNNNGNQGDHVSQPLGGGERYVFQPPVQPFVQPPPPEVKQVVEPPRVLDPRVRVEIHETHEVSAPGHDATIANQYYLQHDDWETDPPVAPLDDILDMSVVADGSNALISDVRIVQISEEDDDQVYASVAAIGADHNSTIGNAIIDGIQIRQNPGVGADTVGLDISARANVHASIINNTIVETMGDGVRTNADHVTGNTLDIELVATAGVVTGLGDPYGYALIGDNTLTILGGADTDDVVVNMVAQGDDASVVNNIIDADMGNGPSSVAISLEADDDHTIAMNHNDIAVTMGNGDRRIEITRLNASIAPTGNMVSVSLIGSDDNTGHGHGHLDSNTIVINDGVHTINTGVGDGVAVIGVELDLYAGQATVSLNTVTIDAGDGAAVISVGVEAGLSNGSIGLVANNSISIEIGDNTPEVDSHGTLIGGIGYGTHVVHPTVNEIELALIGRGKTAAVDGNQIHVVGTAGDDLVSALILAQGQNLEVMDNDIVLSLDDGAAMAGISVIAWAGRYSESQQNVSAAVIGNSISLHMGDGLAHVTADATHDGSWAAMADGNDAIVVIGAIAFGDDESSSSSVNLDASVVGNTVTIVGEGGAEDSVAVVMIAEAMGSIGGSGDFSSVVAEVDDNQISITLESDAQELTVGLVAFASIAVDGAASIEIDVSVDNNQIHLTGADINVEMLATIAMNGEIGTLAASVDNNDVLINGADVISVNLFADADFGYGSVSGNSLGIDGTDMVAVSLVADGGWAAEVNSNALWVGGANAVSIQLAADAHSYSYGHNAQAIVDDNTISVDGASVVAIDLDANATGGTVSYELAQISGNSLTVSDGNDADHISIVANANANSGISGYAQAAIDANDIRIDSNGGNDDIVISLDALGNGSSGDTAEINDNSIAVTAGAGNDAVDVALSADGDHASIASNILSIDTGSGAGDDSMSVALSAQGEHASIVSNVLSIEAGDGANSIHVAVTADGSEASIGLNAINIDGGSGVDDVQLTLAATNGDSFASIHGNSVSIALGGGANVLSLALVATGDDANIGWNAIDVSAGSGNDTIVVRGDATGVGPVGDAAITENHLSIVAGDGADHVTINLHAIGYGLDGNESDGDSSSNNLSIPGGQTVYASRDSSATTVADPYTHTTDSDVRWNETVGNGIISGNTIRVDAGTGADVIAMTLQASGDGDSIVVDGIIDNNDVTILGGTGNDGITVNLVAHGGGYESSDESDSNYALSGSVGVSGYLNGAQTIAQTYTVGTWTETTTVWQEIAHGYAEITGNTIAIDGGAGNDSIALNLTATTDNLSGSYFMDGTVSDNLIVVLGGDSDGNDRINIGLQAKGGGQYHYLYSNGNDEPSTPVAASITGNAEIIGNSIYVDGGAGNDTIQVHFTASAGEMSTGSSYAISGNDLTVLGGADNDLIVISLEASASDTDSVARVDDNTIVVNGDAGNDLLGVGMQAQGYSASIVTNILTIHGGAGTDFVTVELHADGIFDASIAGNVLSIDTAEAISVNLLAEASYAVIADNTIGIANGELVSIAMEADGSRDASIVGNVVTVTADATIALDLDMSLDASVSGGSYEYAGVDSNTLVVTGSSLADQVTETLTASSHGTGSIYGFAEITDNEITITANAGDDHVVLTLDAFANGSSNANALIGNNLAVIQGGAGLDSVAISLDADGVYGASIVSNTLVDSGVETVSLSMLAEASFAVIGHNYVAIMEGAHVSVALEADGIRSASIVANSFTFTANNTVALDLDVSLDASVVGDGNGAHVDSNDFSTVNGSNQADTINISASAYANDDLAEIGHNHVEIHAQAGADQITVSFDAHGDNDANIDFNTIVIGGETGADSMFVDMTASAGDSTIVGNLVAMNGDTGNDTIAIALNAGDSDAAIAANHLNISGGLGDDTMAMDLSAEDYSATIVSNVLTIDGGAGANAIHMGLVADAEYADINHNALTVLGGASNDHVDLSFSAIHATDDAVILSNTVHVALDEGVNTLTVAVHASGNSAVIGHNDFDVTAGTGNDTIVVSMDADGVENIGDATVVANDVSITAGDGDDHIVIDLRGIGYGVYANRTSRSDSEDNVQVPGGNPIYQSLNSTSSSSDSYTATDAYTHLTDADTRWDETIGRGVVIGNSIVVDGGNGADVISVGLQASGEGYSVVGSGTVDDNQVTVLGGAGADIITVDLIARGGGYKTWNETDSNYNLTGSHAVQGYLGGNYGNWESSSEYSIGSWASVVTTWQEVAYAGATADNNMVSINAGSGDDTIVVNLAATTDDLLVGLSNGNNNSYSMEGGSYFMEGDVSNNSIVILGGDGADKIDVGLLVKGGGHYVHDETSISNDENHDGEPGTLTPVTVTGNANMVGNSIYVDGGIGADTISVHLTAAAGEMSTESSYAVSGNDITVLAGADNDLIVISLEGSATGTNSTTRVDDNSVVINGGIGTDTAHVNMHAVGGNDASIVSNVLSIDAVETVSVNLSADASFAVIDDNFVTITGANGVDVSLIAMGEEDAEVDSNLIAINANGNVAVHINVTAMGSSSSSADAYVQHNSVAIDDGAGADTIVVTVSALADDYVDIFSNDITINGNGGADHITVSVHAVSGGDDAIIEDNSIGINAGLGDDIAAVTLSADGEYGSIVNNVVTVHGDAGTDSLTMAMTANGQAEASIVGNVLSIDAVETVTIGGHATADNGDASFVDDTITVTGATLAAVTLVAHATSEASVASEIINVTATASLAVDVDIDLEATVVGGSTGYARVEDNILTVTGGIGADQVDISEIALANVGDAVITNNRTTINTGDGADQIVISFDATGSANAAMVSNTITVNAGADNDVLSVALSAAASTALIQANTVTLHGDGGNDSVVLDLTADGGLGRIDANTLAVYGDAGADSLTVSLDASGSTAVITSNRVTMSGGAGDDTLSLALLADGSSASIVANIIDISGGAGGAVIDADMTADGTLGFIISNALFISGGEGADVVDVNVSALGGLGAGILMNSMEISVGAGNDDISVTLDASHGQDNGSVVMIYGNSLFIDGGDGINTMHVDMTADAEDASVYFNSMVIFGGAADDHIQIDMSAIHGDIAGIVGGNLSEIQLGNGANTLTMNMLATGDFATVALNGVFIAGGTGNDVIALDLTARGGQTEGDAYISGNFLSIVSGAGADNIVVDLHAVGYGVHASVSHDSDFTVNPEIGSGSAIYASRPGNTTIGFTPGNEYTYQYDADTRYSETTGNAVIDGNGILINSGDDADNIVINLLASGDGSPVVNGYVVGNNIALFAGAGDDHVTVNLIAHGGGYKTWDESDSNWTLDGTTVVQGYYNVGGSVSLAPADHSIGTWTQHTTVWQDAAYSGAEVYSNQVSIDAGVGDDTVIVNLAATTDSNVSIGSASYYMYGEVDRNTINVLGGEGDDHIEIGLLAKGGSQHVYDRASGNSDEPTITSTTVSGYAEIWGNTIHVDGGAGADTISVHLTVSDVHSTVGCTYAMTNNHVTIQGGADADNIAFSMTLTGPSAASVRGDNNTILLDGGAGVDHIGIYADVEKDLSNNMTIVGGLADDTIALTYGDLHNDLDSAYIFRYDATGDFGDHIQGFHDTVASSWVEMHFSTIGNFVDVASIANLAVATNSNQHWLYSEAGQDDYTLAYDRDGSGTIAATVVAHFDHDVQLNDVEQVGNEIIVKHEAIG